MITVAEAHRIIRESCAPTGPESVPLSRAVHRVLARPLRSDVDWPPFDTSAMDGYAVRLRDAAAEGASLAERGELVAAGDSAGAGLAPGEAVRVMTGAPLPAGAEAVVPVEKTRREDGRVVLLAVPRPGEHVRRRGESVAAGADLLSPGRRMTPADVALAALAGADPLDVQRRPRIGIVVTGNELVPASQRPGPAQLRDSNGPGLAALCRSLGWEAENRPAVPDEEAAVHRLFAEAGAAEDVLITSGGVSAGDRDLLPGEAARSGFEMLFHGVAVRPGKPIVFARRKRTFWIGLPGNPVSTFVGFHLFARLVLDSLEGAQPPGPAFVSARLAGEVSIRGARETYRDGRLDAAEGENRVAPLASRGSHDLAAHARANALIRVPAGIHRLEPGTLVDCLLL